MSIVQILIIQVDVVRGIKWSVDTQYQVFQHVVSDLFNTCLQNVVQNRAVASYNYPFHVFTTQCNLEDPNHRNAGPLTLLWVNSIAEARGVLCNTPYD
jgi:hypothetical protein